MALEYDPVDQLLGATVHSNGIAGAILKKYVYGYDKLGNRTSEQNDLSVTTGAHDNLNQLTSTAVSNGPVRFAGSINEPGTVNLAGSPARMDLHNTGFVAYASLALGTNTVSIQATDYSANTATTNYQIVVTNSGLGRTMSYDLNGNLTNSTAVDATNSFEWDAANRLTRITQVTATNSVLVSEFSYDGVGRRIRIVEKINGEVQSNKAFLWCGTELSEERDSTGATVSKRFLGAGEQIGGTNYFFTRDHLGSLREMTDGAGAIRARYDYDPFGRKSKVSGDLEGDFGFTGHFLHASSGFGLTLFRAYDAQTGRWLSKDPAEEAAGLNLYAYVDGNPLNGIDPSGLWNIWNPATYGVANGAGSTIYDSLDIFGESAAWGGFGLKTSLQGAAAFIDGIIPFADPFARMGAYDPCDKAFQASRKVGEWTRDIELMLLPGNFLKFLKNVPLIGKNSLLFGKTTGLLNSNDYLRIGWSFKKGVGEVFRAVIGGKKTPVGQWISKMIPAALRHFDF
jgi:RHS repeat-associated protein